MGHRQGRTKAGVRGILILAILLLALAMPQQYVAGSARFAANGGALSAWGDNGGGQLGDGSAILRDEPVRVLNTGSGGFAFIATDAGIGHSMGLTADGTVYTWGNNLFGQLDGGLGGFSTTPTKVNGTGPGGVVFTAIAAGTFFSLGLTANGTAYGWGDNREGQLGDGSSGSTGNGLVQVSGTGPGGIVLTIIAAGASHSLGLAANGTAYAWGYNEYAQLGNGVSGTGVRSTTPVQVSGTGPGGLVLTALTAGNLHSLGQTANGTAYAWGENTYGQLGIGSSGGLATTPTQVAGTGPGGNALIAISAGVYHSLGLKADGTAYAWGRNIEGQLGDGTSGAGNIKTSPQQVPATGAGGIVLTAIATGGYHSLGLKADGTAYAWGQNQFGQIGNGTSGTGVIQTTPVAVAGTGPSGVKLTAIVGGGFFSLASGDAGDPNCAGFADLAASDPACPAIAALTQRGVIRGYATVPPTFGPNDNVQRAQMAAFLVRALAWQARPTTPRTFTDLAGLVAELRTAALIVANTCDNNGLCVAYGYGDGRFGPTDPVSHAQVITFITRAFRLDPEPGLAAPAGRPPAPRRRPRRPRHRRAHLHPLRRGHPRRPDQRGGLERPRLPRLGRPAPPPGPHRPTLIARSNDEEKARRVRTTRRAFPFICAITRISRSGRWDSNPR